MLSGGGRLVVQTREASLTKIWVKFKVNLKSDVDKSKKREKCSPKYTDTDATRRRLVVQVRRCSPVDPHAAALDGLPSLRRAVRARASPLDALAKVA
jgi:hypothetical protein